MFLNDVLWLLVGLSIVGIVVECVLMVRLAVYKNRGSITEGTVVSSQLVRDGDSVRAVITVEYTGAGGETVTAVNDDIIRLGKPESVAALYKPGDRKKIIVSGTDPGRFMPKDPFTNACTIALFSMVMCCALLVYLVKLLLLR